MGIYRYKNLVNTNATMSFFPKIIISNRTTDKYVLYNIEKTRYDSIAYQMYGDDTYWWIIALANAEYYLEFDIPQNTSVRVPFPLNDVLSEYNDKIKKNKDLG